MGFWKKLFGKRDEGVSAGLKKVQELVRKNPDVVFSTDHFGRTLLHYAAGTRGRKDVAEFLLANNADVNAVDGSGDTPLRWAVVRGNRETADFLRQHGGHE